MKIDKRKFLGTIIGSAMFLAVIAALTYAMFFWRSEDTSLTFNINDEYFRCESGIESNISGLAPVTNYRNGSYQKFTVNNIGRSDTTFSLTLNITNIDEALKDESFKYKLVVDQTGGGNNCADPNNTSCVELDGGSGNFSEAIVGMNNVVPTIPIPNNSRYEYYFFMYIDGNMENDPAMQTSSMTSILDVCEVVVFLNYHGGNRTLDFLKVTDDYSGLPSTVTRDNTVVTYDTKGGSSVNNSTISYTFAGWYLEDDYKTRITSSTKVTSTTNHTLHAKWTASSTVTLPTPTKSGYEFLGWYDAKDNLVGQGGSTYAPEKSVTLYAKWKKTVTATFYYYNNQTKTVSCDLINSDTSCSVKAPASLGTPTNYSFRGWSTSNTAAATINLNASASTNISANTNYYASYSKEITATFRYSTLTTENYTYSGHAGTTATAKGTEYMNYTGTIDTSTGKITIPTAVRNSTGGAAAETYAGLSTSADSIATAVNSTTTTVPATTTTYYAIYNENLTFHYYNESGGSTSLASKRWMLYKNSAYRTVLYNTSGTVINAPTPTSYDGASYKSWSYTNDSINVRTPLETGVNSLYAVYQKTITVSYNANGGTGAPENQTGTKTYIAKSNATPYISSPSITVSTTKPTKTGYIFEEWNSALNGSGKDYTGGTSYTFENSTTLYAIYTDGTPPTVSITRTDYNTFSWTATDTAGITGYAITNSPTEPTTWTTTGTLTSGTYNVSESEANTYYLWAKDAAGNTNKTSITSYTVTRSQGTGTTLTTKYDTTSESNGTAFTSNTFIVLGGTNIWAKATENDGYNKPVLKRNGSTVTNPSYVAVTAALTIASSATTNKAEVTIKKDGSNYSGLTVALYQSETSKYTNPSYASGVYTFSTVKNGTYDIYVGGNDTGVDITVSNGSGTATLNYYTLTLSKGTGISSVSGAGVYLSETEVEIDATPSTGYTWSTWTKVSGTNPSNFTATTKNQTIKMGAGTVTLQATATKTPYTVTLTKGTGISAVSGAGTYYYGDSVTIDATVASGYTWKNWTGTHATTTKKYTFTMPASNVTDTANAEANNYTITYYLGKGESTADATELGTTTCKYNSSCTLTAWSTFGATFPNSNNKWGFSGWGTNSSSKTVEYTNGKNFTYTLTNNLSLYAIGSRKFVFYSGKAPTSSIGSDTQYWNPYSTATSYLTSISVPTETTISGWTFIGYRGNNTASEQTSFASGTRTPTAGSYTSMDFRSIYERTLTISYNGNGSTSGSTENTTGKQYYNSGYASSSGTNSGANTSEVTFTLATNGFTKTGHVFSKWADGSVSGTQYAEGASYKWNPTVDTTTLTKTMYAIWNDNTAPTVSINRTDYNTFSWTASDNVGITGYAITNSPTAPTSWTTTGTLTSGTYDVSAAKTYYVWVKDAAGNTNKASITSYTVTRTQGTGTTLTTKFESSSGTSFTDATKIVLNGTKINISASLNNGYSGLSLKVNGTAFTSGNTTTITGNTTIASSATLTSFTVTLTKGTGISSVTGAGTYNTGDSVTVTATASTGYTFLNWSGTGVSSSTSSSYTFTMPASDVTLTANATYTATPTITRSDYNTFTYTGTGAKAYYVSTSSTSPSAGSSAASSTFALNTWTTATSTGDLTLAAGTTYYVFIKDATIGGNVSSNKATIAVRTVTRSQGTGTTLTTKLESSSGTSFTDTTKIVLNGTPINTSASLNNGYSGLSLKVNGTAFTSGNATTITGDTTIASSATANTYTVNFYQNTDYMAEESVIVHLKGQTLYRTSSLPILTGYTYSTSGNTCAVSVGTSAEAVTYGNAYRGEEYGYAGTFEYTDGKTYYYSGGTGCVTGDQTDSSGNNRTKYSNLGTGDAAYQLLEDNLSTVSQSFNYGESKSLTANSYTRSGYTFMGWSTSPTGTVTYTNSQSVSNLTSTSGGVINLYAVWKDNTNPVATITTTNTLKQTSQTATLSCTDNSGVVSYYWGTSSPTSSSTYTAITPTVSMSVEKTVAAADANTYYLSCKDGAGNVSNTESITYHRYSVYNLIQKLGGTSGTYNTTNYGSQSSAVYIAKRGKVITLNDAYSIPTGASSSTFKGVSAGAAPSTTAVTVSTESQTLLDNSIYAFWFDRSTYTVTLNKGTGISAVTGAGTYYYGASVTIDATVSTGYTWQNWSGTHSTTTKSYTFTMPASNITDTANAADVTAPTKPTRTRSDFNTFTYSSTDGVGVTGYYVSTSSTAPTVSGTPQSTFALNKWTTATSTGNLTLSAGTYYVWARDAAGNRSEANSIGAYTVTRNQGTGTTLTTRYDSTSSSTGTAFTSNTVVLSGTNVWASASANTGYKSVVLKRGGSTATNPSYAAVTAAVTIASSATANTYTYYLVGMQGTNSSYFKTMTNMLSNPGFESGTSQTAWGLNGASITTAKKSSGSYSALLPASSSAILQQKLSSPPTVNHYYYGRTDFVSASGFTSGDNRLELWSNDNANGKLVFANKTDATTSWIKKGGVGRITSSTYLGSGNTWYLRNFMVNGSAASYVDNVMLIDLTTTFGSGSEVTNATVLSKVPFFTSKEYIYKGTATYNSTFTLPTPTRSGYEFKGWYTATSGGTKITTSTKWTNTNSTTVYYAQWKRLLTSASVGSYVSYQGTNGCSGNYCTGTPTSRCWNANGYSLSGWRYIGKSSSGEPYIVTAGAPECLCTKSDFNPLNQTTSCGSLVEAANIGKHQNNLLNVAKKYCNSSLISGGDCSNTNKVRIINGTDFTNITGSTLANCYYVDSSSSCGYNNNLINVNASSGTQGGDYWFYDQYGTNRSLYSWASKSVADYNSAVSSGVRPVMLLKKMYITGGSGTASSPYTISAS